MRRALGKLAIELEIAIFGLFANRFKTVIVGGITGFVALLIVVGSSIFTSVDRGIQRSISSSIAGDIQVYSAESKGELALLGGTSAADLAPLDDFGRIRTLLTALPNVKAVVPMGMIDAVASSGNLLDRALQQVRGALEQMDRSPSSLEARQDYEQRVRQVRRAIDALRTQTSAGEQVLSALPAGSSDALQRVAADEFWTGLEHDREQGLNLLENVIAPLASDTDAIPLRIVGTNPQAFQRAFERMQLVEGTAIPPGERGFLFSKLVYEQQIKLRAARALDFIQRARAEQHIKIADDPELQRVVGENANGVSELLLQLDEAKLENVRNKLQKFLPSKEADVGKLLTDFFTMSDANFDDRYAFFYRDLAPELKMYRFAIGDSIAVKMITRAGYVRSVNVRVYGTFAFKGLENSPHAGAINMVDLVTFRDLYGFMTPDHEREITQIRASAGASDLARENVEASLFGSVGVANDASPTDPGRAIADELAPLRGTRARLTKAQKERYDPKELEQGSVLNAAVLVADDAKLAETLSAIDKASRQAGLSLKAVTGRQATGILGEFLTLIGGILFAAVLTIFLVALVVLNNALVMATLDRVAEIGTLRAIGARRSFVLSMILVESACIGVVSGTIGAAIGSAIVAIVGSNGIPASNEVMTFFFSGPRLYPAVSLPQVVFALLTVLAVSLLSGFYPALLAVRVSPRLAMHSED